jgi:hypothetical protein
MHSYIKQKIGHVLSKDLRSDLSAMPLFSDEELWNTARFSMDGDEQVELESLAELQKQRQLSESEKLNLNRLMEEAQYVMLRKAEAYVCWLVVAIKCFHQKIFLPIYLNANEQSNYCYGT